MNSLIEKVDISSNRSKRFAVAIVGILYLATLSVVICELLVRFFNPQEYMYSKRPPTTQPAEDLIGEVCGFFRQTKKWWLLPLLIILLIFLVFLSGTGVAPFIYTLF
jgi:hypothetical protein